MAMGLNPAQLQVGSVGSGGDIVSLLAQANNNTGLMNSINAIGQTTSDNKAQAFIDSGKGKNLTSSELKLALQKNGGDNTSERKSKFLDSIVSGRKANEDATLAKVALDSKRNYELKKQGIRLSAEEKKSARTAKETNRHNVFTEDFEVAKNISKGVENDRAYKQGIKDKKTLADALKTENDAKRKATDKQNMLNNANAYNIAKLNSNGKDPNKVFNDFISKFVGKKVTESPNFTKDGTDAVVKTQDDKNIWFDAGFSGLFGSNPTDKATVDQIVFDATNSVDGRKALASKDQEAVMNYVADILKGKGLELVQDWKGLLSIEKIK